MNFILKNTLKIYWIALLLLLYLCTFTFTLLAYQPQSGSLPRWSKGIGIQTGYQNKLYGSNANKEPSQINALYWLEGAYSFNRWLGITTRITWNQIRTGVESNDKFDYNSLAIRVPFKSFFDQESVTWNSFIIPALIYYLPNQKWQGGGTIGLFRESFYTYFTLAFTYLTTLNEVVNKDLNPKLDYTDYTTVAQYTVKSDLGLHLYYNEEHLTGFWALAKINLHRGYFLDDINVYHLTIQPTLLAYYQSTTMILRYSIPIWQYNNHTSSSHRDTAFLRGGFEIGFASAF